MKYNKGIAISILIILFILTTISGITYSIIYNSNTNKITIKDLLINKAGNYNKEYYIIKNTCHLNDSEMIILIESDKINDFINMYFHKIDGSLSDKKLYEMLSKYVNNDESLNLPLKKKVLIACNKFINEIAIYLDNKKELINNSSI